MRVTSVELHPANSEEFIVLSFRDPQRSLPYNVVEISGLDPDVIVPRYYGVSENSGELFYSLSLEKREPVYRIVLNPNVTTQSYSELRDNLYKMISSSRTGLIETQFKDGDEVLAVISGWVTKVETPQFTNLPEIRLTFKTKDPWLKAPEATEIDVDGLDPSDTHVEDDVSTAPHGGSFSMLLLANTPSLVISDPVNPSWSFVVTPDGGFLNGDIFHITSDPLNKQVYVIRGEDTIYLADRLSARALWPIVFPGDNAFSVDPPEAVEWTAISYFLTYWGV